MINSNSNDIFGIRPFGEAAKILVDKSFDGLGAFLSSICLPACEEVGLLLRDQVRTWRFANVANMLTKAKGKLDFIDGEIQLKAHPRVAMSIIENASVVDDEILQEWWAGLFASSCTEDGRDDQNLVFSNLLKQLTVLQVKLLGYCCINCIKSRYPNGLILCRDKIQMDIDKIIEITGVDDMYRIDREIDHLGYLGLLTSGAFSYSGFIVDEKQLIADLIPSSLGLNLFYKANAVHISQEEFWKDKLVDVQDDK